MFNRILIDNRGEIALRIIIGYARSVGETRLPSVIGFCAAC